MSLIPWKHKQREGNGTEELPLTSLRTEMDRLLDSFVREPLAAFDQSLAGLRGWEPAVDIAENDQEVTVRAEMPGMKAEDIEVTVSGNQLVLAGEKKETVEDKGRGYYRTETRYGSFRRVIPLPDGVDADHVEAEHALGVLTVRLKKSPSAAAKRIEVKKLG